MQKSIKTKFFLSVLVKNLNWYGLPKNVVTFDFNIIERP